MMDLLYRVREITGTAMLAENAKLPEKEVFRNLLQKLPKAQQGIENVKISLEVPEALKNRLMENYQIAYQEGTDAFFIETLDSKLLICSETIPGILSAIYSLLRTSGQEGIPCGFFYGAPKTGYRGLKLYIPGPKPEDIEEFKQIIDMAVCYRHNSIMIEVGGAMEYKRHPKINEAWITYCNEMKRYPKRAEEVQRGYSWQKNSIHFENGDGYFLSQEKVKELVAYCRERGLEVIPEVPLLSHSDYILNAYPEIAERSEDPFPDTYCPNHPDTYRIVFDILDEVIEVFEPKTINIAHDEFYSFGLCERCKELDPAKIFADDIRKIHDYLKERDIESMIWCEKLLDVHDKTGMAWGGAKLDRILDNGAKQVIPATYHAIDMIPEDIWCHHWYWELREYLEDEFLKRGIKTSFGNFSPLKMPRWKERVEAGIIGGAVSSWTHSKFVNFQRDAILFDMVFQCYLNWGPDFSDEEWEDLLPVLFEELYDYHYRELLKKPHLKLTHHTTIDRPWVYLTSLFVEDEAIGHYHITYTNGKTLDIPLFYGINISNGQRSWERHEDEAFEIIVPDSLLLEASYTTLPKKRADGTTCYVLPVEDPYPEEAISSVSIVKETEDLGEIFLLGLEREEGTKAERKLFEKNQENTSANTCVN